MRTVTDADRAIGQRIRTARKRCGLSIARLADALHVSVQQMQKYEQGQNRIAAAKLVTVSQVLDAKLTELAGIDETKSNHIDLSTRSLEVAALFERIDDKDTKDAVFSVVRASARKR